MATRPLLTAWAACLAALCGPALLPAAGHAATPPLVGAATHPLWDDSTPEDAAAELDRLVEAGGNVVRIDISWASLEGARGQYVKGYYEKADGFFAQARERGLRVIVTFWATPCWASIAPEEKKQGCTGAWWTRGVERYPPEDPADFARTAAWVADRWEGDLAAIEIWNEPNCTCWFTPESEATRVAEYVEMLRLAQREIEAAAPGVEVLGPAMLFSHGEFLDAFYAQGGGQYVDGVSVRPFSQHRDPTDETVPEAGRMYSLIHGVEWLRQIMAAHGDGAKPMWFTEIGWSSCTGTSQWCLNPDRDTSEALQARYTGAALRLVRDRWDFVRGISFYNLRNKSEAPESREDQMGLLRRNFEPKPAYWAFKEALSDLAAKPFSQPLLAAAAESAAPAPPDATTTGTTLDLPPELGRLVLTRAVLRRGGPRVFMRFSLSEPARVTLKFERARRGRWVAVRGALRRAGTAGANRLRLSGRLLGRRLPPGRYRLSAVAIDPAGNASVVQRARFRVAR
jgi:hypothetical protein